MRCARPTGWVVFLVIAVAPLGARAELPDELAAAAAGAVREGVETDPRGELSPTSPWPHVVGPSDPHVIRPLRAEEPMATMQFDVPMPVIRQRGDKTNCGPTTAAMALAAFQKVSSPGELRALRDTVGEWSWQAFPLRQMRLPGYDAGMTTRAMMKEVGSMTGLMSGSMNPRAMQQRMAQYAQQAGMTMPGMPAAGEPRMIPMTAAERDARRKKTKEAKKARKKQRR